MHRNNLIWIAIGLLILVGTVMSWYDYRVWRHAETDNFGQSSQAEIGVSSAVELALPVASLLGEVRVKPPEGWLVKENLEYVSTAQKSAILPSNSLAELLKFSEPNGGAKIVIYAQKTSADLTALADLAAKGATEDRRYINTGSISMTILTWANSQQITQKVLAVVDGKFIVIEVTCDANAWKQWTKTFDAVYHSLTRI